MGDLAPHHSPGGRAWNPKINREITFALRYLHAKFGPNRSTWRGVIVFTDTQTHRHTDKQNNRNNYLYKHFMLPVVNKQQK